MKKISFGTGGFRAIIGEDFTKENIQKICQAISNIIIKDNKIRKICIGYDHRFMSEEFAKWSAEVFAGNEIEVEIMATPTTTPVVMFATMLNNFDYGIMITASHNPYIYNGVKVFVQEGRDAGLEDTKRIENEIEELNKIKSIGFSSALSSYIKTVDYIDAYIKNILRVVGIDKKSSDISIVFDVKHGSSVKELELLMQGLNIKNYHLINANRDPNFGFEQPAPSANNLTKLKEKMFEVKADIGFALDADGDRLAVIDKNGNYIDNNYILAIVYYYLVKYKGEKGDSVKNISTSNLLDVITEKLGYTCHEVPVGFKFVSSSIIENNAVIGGESSGGLAIQGHIWGKDSLIAIALCLNAIIDINKPFEEIVNEVLNFVGGYSKIIKDTQYLYTEEQRKIIDDILFVKKLTPQSSTKITKVVYGDYFKVYYENGDWAVIRFSGTEPILRIYVEAEDEMATQQLINDWEKLLGLGIPMIV